jgi:TrmH family RNA methyltransferase
MKRNIPHGERRTTSKPFTNAATGKPAPHAALQGSEVIRSRDNQWVKRFRTALRETAPQSAGQIGVEGPHLIGEAARSAATRGLIVDAILMDSGGERHLKAFAPFLVAASGNSEGPRILRTTGEIFRSVAATEAPQGIAALVRLREYSLNDLPGGKSAGERSNPLLLVVLVGVQDPGNVGTAVRSAEAFGATALIATKGTAHPWSQKALRASSGSALRLPIVTGIAPADLITGLHGQPHAAKPTPLRICGTCIHPPDGRTAASPQETDLRGPVALLIGNEGAGLDDSILRAADALISVPLASPVESLNAGVAASLLLYEAARQRGAIR